METDSSNDAFVRPLPGCADASVKSVRYRDEDDEKKILRKFSLEDAKSPAG